MFYELRKAGPVQDFSETSLDEVRSIVPCLGYAFVDGHPLAKLPSSPAGASNHLLPRRMCLSACH